MALRQQDTFPRIVRDPRILAGEPTVKGTRLSVRLFMLALRHDPDVEHLLEDYPTLDRTAVEQALGFYATHQPEINRYIRENQDDAD